MRRSTCKTACALMKSLFCAGLIVVELHVNHSCLYVRVEIHAFGAQKA